MEQQFEVGLVLKDGYAFDVDFRQSGTNLLRVDEPPPLGAGSGPNPVRLLAAAVGNCMGASLLFCLQRSRTTVSDLRVDVSGTIERNERGRFRVTQMQVHLHPTVAAGGEHAFERCLGLFEDFCIVGQSVRQGIDLHVEVSSNSSNPVLSGD